MSSATDEELREVVLAMLTTNETAALVRKIDRSNDAKIRVGHCPVGKPLSVFYLAGMLSQWASAQRNEVIGAMRALRIVQEVVERQELERRPS